MAGCSGKDAATEVTSKLPPQPPMWVVSDADSEITLYPTLHILPTETQWKSDEMTKRLADAEEVWFEIMPGSENDPALQQAMISLGMAPGSSLSAKLSEEETAALKTAIKPLEPIGMTFPVIDQMRPWVVTTFVTVGACLLYTSPSPRDATLSRMPSSA